MNQKLASALKAAVRLTINSDLAVTVSVTGLEESLGLSVGQSSGRGAEVLQEQPGEEQKEAFSKRAEI